MQLAIQPIEHYINWCFDSWKDCTSEEQLRLATVEAKIYRHMDVKNSIFSSGLQKCRENIQHYCDVYLKIRKAINERKNITIN